MPVTSAISRVPQRWIVCALCSLALAYISLKDFCFYAIAAIVDYTEDKRRHPRGGCPFLFSGSVWERRELPLVLPDLYWNSKAVELADNTFYIGKLLMVLPAGVLSDIGYSRYVLGGGMLFEVISSLVVTTLAKPGIIMYMLQNFFEGVGEALIYPSIFTLISRWALPSERNLYTALVVSGIFYGDNLGHVFFNVIFLGYRSWKVGNFSAGALGLVWLAFGYIFIYHSPDQSPFIRQQEYPTRSSVHRKRTVPLMLRRLKKIPWLSIVSSRAFLSLVLAYCSVDWASFAIVWDTIATYQKYILRLPERFSEESTLMVFAVIPSALMAGFIADWLIKLNVMPKTVVKKTFTFISVFSSSLLQVAANLAGCNIMLFWVLSIIAVYILGLAIPVVYSAPTDLSARHAGLLMAIMTGARTLCDIFKITVYEFLTDNYDPDQWQRKFITCSALSLALIIPFIFYGTGEAQHWSKPSRQVTPTASELETLHEPNPHGRRSDQNTSQAQTKIWSRLSNKFW